MKQISLFLLLVLLVACKQAEEPKTKENVVRQKVTVEPKVVKKSNKIDAKTAMKMIQDKPTIRLIDVRTPGEIADGSIEGALQMDFNGKSFKEDIKNLNKEDEYIVFCRSGGRSAKAVKMMKTLGIEEVYDLKDGYKSLNEIMTKETQ